MSFYYFTDYLCFYGVLCFILFTTINKNIYLNILFFIFLGIYFSFLENRAAVLFWITTAIAGLGFWGLKLIIPYIDTRRFKDIFYSNYMFVLIIILISLLTLISSIYFWSNEYNLSLNIKDTILDAPVVRGKIMETSLYGLNDLKSFLFGVGWGMVPDLLLENMNSWQYDELRLGYNLHFHTHNDLAEHLISLGIVGGVLFVLYIYFIFKESDKFSFASKLGWLLFFKINCFWFLWTGTLPLFAIVVSCFIFTDIKKNKLRTFFLKVSQVKRVSFSLLFFSIGALLFFGAIFSFSSTKVHSMLRYDRIIEHIKSKNDVNKKSKCLGFYSDFDRGGFLLERFLGRYADYIFSLNIKDVDADAFSVLYELQCKANSIIEKNNYTFALLNTAMQIDSNFYYKFGDTEEGREYLRKNYNKWFAKASIMSEKMPNRGDLILPFLSYASNNAKNEDALKVCMNKVKGIEAFCDLILAKKILDQEDINQELILQSIGLIKKAINKGIFNELIYGYWYNRHEEFDFFGLRGIPLSPDIIFLISDKEKFKLEETIKNIE